MHLDLPFTIKHLDSAVAGELVCLPWARKRAFAIASKSDGINIRLAVLKLDVDPAQLPFHHRLLSDDYCLSYGEEWAVELVPTEETTPGNMAFVDSPGAIYVSERQRLLRLGRPISSIEDTAVFFDLDSWKFGGSAPKQAAPIVRWRVWAKPGLSLQIGAVPILEFPPLGANPADSLDSAQ